MHLQRRSWSNETEVELFASVLSVTWDTSRSSCAVIATVVHGGGSCMLWGCFSASRTEALLRVERKPKRARCRDMLKKAWTTALTLSSQPGLQLLRATQWTSLNGPAGALPCLEPNLTSLEWPENGCQLAVPSSTWQSWRGSGRKISKSRCGRLVTSEDSRP